MSFPPKHVKIRFGRSSDLSHSLRYLPIPKNSDRGVYKEPFGIYSCGNSSGLAPDSLFTFMFAVNTPTPILAAKVINDILERK